MYGRPAITFITCVPIIILSSVYIHNKFTIKKQRQDEKDMLEAS